jgi:hypothetical protein
MREDTELPIDCKNLVEETVNNQDQDYAVHYYTNIHKQL